HNQTEDVASVPAEHESGHEHADSEGPAKSNDGRRHADEDPTDERRRRRSIPRLVEAASHKTDANREVNNRNRVAHEHERTNDVVEDRQELQMPQVLVHWLMHLMLAQCAG